MLQVEESQTCFSIWVELEELNLQYQVYDPKQFSSDFVIIAQLLLQSAD